MLDQYIRQYGKRLYGLCRTLCQDPFEADDLYQETWLRALNNLDRYDPSLPFEPWLTRICVNLYRNTLRRLARSPLFRFRTQEEQDAVMNSLPAPEIPDYRELYDAIDALPEKLRLVVILYYFEDMDVQKVGDVLKIPAGTVKSRLSKARGKLKEVLKDADL